LEIDCTGYIATVLGLGTMAGGLIGGSIADRIGQKKSVQTAVVASLVGVGILPFISAHFEYWSC